MFLPILLLELASVIFVMLVPIIFGNMINYLVPSKWQEWNESKQEAGWAGNY